MDEYDFYGEDWAMEDESGFYDGEIGEWMTTTLEDEPYEDENGKWLSSASTPDFDGYSTTNLEINNNDTMKANSDVIARVERLRLEFSRLIGRKDIAINMLGWLFENGVVRQT